MREAVFINSKNVDKMRFFLIKYITVIILVWTSIGCVDTIDYSGDVTDSRLVVQSIITNEKGPYFVLLTKTVPLNHETTSHYDNLNKYVMDATVTISDSKGNVEVLSQPERLPESDSLFREGADQAFYTGYDGRRYNIYTPFTSSKFIFYTKTTEGHVGRTYNLKIEYNGKTYSASETMLPAPEVDSLTFNKRLTKEKDYIWTKPTLHFKNPSGLNYYMFEYINTIPSFTQNHKTSVNNFWHNKQFNNGWKYEVINDRALPEPYVNNLKIDIGDGLNPPFSHYNRYKKIEIGMSSISKKAYRHYKSLKSQTKAMGGVFQPSSVNAHSNINNGALGYFRVSSISRVSADIEE